MRIIKKRHKIAISIFVFIIIIHIILIFTPVSTIFLPDKESSIKLYICMFILTDSILILSLIYEILIRKSVVERQKEKENAIKQYQLTKLDYNIVNNMEFEGTFLKLRDKLRNLETIVIDLEDLIYGYKNKIDQKQYNYNKNLFKFSIKLRLEEIIIAYVNLSQKYKNKEGKESRKKFIIKETKLIKEITDLTKRCKEFKLRMRIQFDETQNDVKLSLESKKDTFLNP